MFFFFPESTMYHPNIFQRKSLQSCKFVMAFCFLKNSNCKNLLLHIQKCLWKCFCKEGSNCWESFQTLQFSVEMHKLLRGGWTGGRVNILYKQYKITLNPHVEHAGPSCRNLLRSIKILILIFIGCRLTSSLFCGITLWWIYFILRLTCFCLHTYC